MHASIRGCNQCCYVLSTFSAAMFRACVHASIRARTHASITHTTSTHACVRARWHGYTNHAQARARACGPAQPCPAASASVRSNRLDGFRPLPSAPRAQVRGARSGPVRVRARENRQGEGGGGGVLLCECAVPAGGGEWERAPVRRARRGTVDRGEEVGEGRERAPSEGGTEGGGRRCGNKGRGENQGLGRGGGEGGRQRGRAPAAREARGRYAHMGGERGALHPYECDRRTADGGTSARRGGGRDGRRGRTEGRGGGWMSGVRGGRRSAPAGEELGARDALLLGLVGEHRPCHAVPDRVHPLPAPAHRYGCRRAASFAAAEIVSSHPRRRPHPHRRRHVAMISTIIILSLLPFSLLPGPRFEARPAGIRRAAPRSPLPPLSPLARTARGCARNSLIAITGSHASLRRP